VIQISEARAGQSSNVVIQLRGNDASESLARCIGLAIEAGERSIVVDLGDAETASASLLAVLHGAARRVRERGGRFAVVSRHPGLRRLLDMTCLTLTLDVVETREEALEG
jgi:anti-anti-sigma factor